MKITPRFGTAIKISLFVVVVLFIYSFLLSYKGILGYSISRPSENTDVRMFLNKLKELLSTGVFWMLVGYISKDNKAAIIALILSIAIHFGVDVFLPNTSRMVPTMSYQFYLRLILSVIPILIFGLVHFKSSLGLKFIGFWIIIWSLTITFDPSNFERMIEGFTRMIGWRKPFEIRISTGENSYRPISIFRILHRELFLIVKLCIFWWIYQLIKTKQSILGAMQTCYDMAKIDRLSYSAIYWSLRIFLFVGGLGIVSFIANSFRLPFDMVLIIRVMIGTGALVIVAAIYRNFLVSHFAHRSQYLGGLYFLLNIPIVNVLAWLYALITFDIPPNAADESSSQQERFTQLKSDFVKENKNNGWKIVIIVFTSFTLLYQLNKAGFRIDGPSRDGAYMTFLISLVLFCLVLFFLYNKNAYKPLLTLFCLNVVLIAIYRNESFLYPAMATSIINMVLFYGMFYFDELKWDENQTLE